MAAVGSHNHSVMVCAADAAVNDFAGDGLDMRYEDQGRDVCGV